MNQQQQATFPSPTSSSSAQNQMPQGELGCLVQLQNLYQQIPTPELEAMIRSQMEKLLHPPVVEQTPEVDPIYSLTKEVVRQMRNRLEQQLSDRLGANSDQLFFYLKSLICASKEEIAQHKLDWMSLIEGTRPLRRRGNVLEIWVDGVWLERSQEMINQLCGSAYADLLLKLISKRQLNYCDKFVSDSEEHPYTYDEVGSVDNAELLDKVMFYLRVLPQI